MSRHERAPRIPTPRPVRRKTRRILFSHEGTDYEHVQLVTEGPHGERVLLARRHPPEGPPELVVVKALSCRQPREALRRWRHEVWLASHLAHPGIARVLGHHPRANTAYTVSEFIEGRSLEKALAYAALRGQPLSEPLGLHLCAEVAGVLHHAHTRVDARGQSLGIVHRDVCPSNLRVSREGEVKVLNFNVAWSRLPKREPTPPSEGPRGDLVYAAPERLLPEGEDAAPDPRSDLFSLGLVLLELLTGQHLYYLPSLEARAAHALAGASQAPELEELRLRADSFRPEDVAQAVKPLAPPVQAVLRKLLRREVPERHATGEVLQADLRHCLQSLRPGYGAKQVARELAQLEAEVAPLRYQAEAAGTFSEPPALPVSPEGDTP